MSSKFSFKKTCHSATNLHTNMKTHTVTQQALVRMLAFSTVIMGLYTAVMHSSLRLALLQMERQ